MFFKPKPFLKEKQLKTLLLFSSGVFSADYVIGELDKKEKLSEKIKIVGGITNCSRAHALDILSVRKIDCSVFDQETFAKKRGLGIKSAEIEYLKSLKKEVEEFSPNIILSDGFGIESVLVSKAFSLPVLEIALASIEGKGITVFSGSYAIRDAILSDKRELQAGAFLNFDEKKYLVVMSRKMPLDLKRLAEIKSSEDFEKFVRMVKEKFNSNNMGPAMLKALELLTENRVEIKNKKLILKQKEEWMHGFYNMTTDCIQTFYGILP